MTTRAIPLQPFAAATPPWALRLEAVATRAGDVLKVGFRLEGETAGIVPAYAPGPGTRREGLWRDTCFEAFVAVAGEARYLEVNLAPTRDWNVYLFDGYRLGLRPDAASFDPPRATDQGDGALTASFSLPLTSLAPGDRVLEVGLAAVIRHADGRLDHWALAHPGDRPDFHLREGFLLRC